MDLLEAHDRWVNGLRRTTEQVCKIPHPAAGCCAQQVIQQVRPSVGAVPLGNGRHRQSDGGANLRQCAAMQRSTSFVSEELEQRTC